MSTNNPTQVTSEANTKTYIDGAVSLHYGIAYNLVFQKMIQSPIDKRKELLQKYYNEENLNQIIDRLRSIMIVEDDRYGMKINDFNNLIKNI